MSNFPLFHYTHNHDQTDFVAEKNICTRAFLAANILRYAIFRLSRKAAVTFIKAAGGETEEIRLGGRACGGCVVDARTLRAAALVRTCTTPVAVTTFVDATQSRRVTVVTSPTHTHTQTNDAAMGIRT